MPVSLEFLAKKRSSLFVFKSRISRASCTSPLFLDNFGRSLGDVHDALDILDLKTNKDERFLARNSRETGIMIFTCVTNLKCVLGIVTVPDFLSHLSLVNFLPGSVFLDGWFYSDVRLCPRIVSLQPFSRHSESFNKGSQFSRCEQLKSLASWILYTYMYRRTVIRNL
jgi:hypothetical protein